MSISRPDELTDVLDRVKNWSSSARIALVKGILDSLSIEESIGMRATDSAARSPRGISAEEIQDLLRTDRPAPDDETVQRWVDEHRTEKYG